MNSKHGSIWREQYQKTLSLTCGDKSYWSLKNLANEYGFKLNQLPYVKRLVLENVLRHAESDADHDPAAFKKLIKQLGDPNTQDVQGVEITFRPGRVLMQDYTGVPAVADLAAMRDAVAAAGGDPERVNPQCQVDMVIDHSVIIDESGTVDAIRINREKEMERNQERYKFLKWAQQSFKGLTVIPPGRGICHQVNLEFFAEVVLDDHGALIPDTLVGTDSHTTMVNGLGVFGWGVGGIEAEAVMLGQPLTIDFPQVVGVKLEGMLPLGVTATDLVLRVTETLREHGVVGKYVEFYGPGVLCLEVPDRATIANMSPEYGATTGLFPIDDKVIEYLELTNRPQEVIERVKQYAQAQGLWYDAASPDPVYAENLTINLGTTQRSVAGPRRPQDRLSLSGIKSKTIEEIELSGHAVPSATDTKDIQQIQDGDLVIAAITSCTNTSNPHVMLQAGLMARNAVRKGLKVNPSVKTSLAPGSQVVARYLDSSGLQDSLNELGFHRVGFGCTTCIGNSGPLKADLESIIEAQQLSVSAVLSGNRNYGGRIHPWVRLNWLASPPLVVAYALAGHTRIDLETEPLGQNNQGQDVFLKDIWPSGEELTEVLGMVTQKLYESSYQNMFEGDEQWEALKIEQTALYPWDDKSTYIHQPPFYTIESEPKPIVAAKILALFGDTITTDHISPAGKIDKDSPAGLYLQQQKVEPAAFNSYGARRGNDEVMMRGTFANPRVKNKIVEPKEDGYTKVMLDDAATSEPVPIYDASVIYKKHATPLVIFAGKEYGSGSSRDWAAKGCLLLGVKAVIAESYERIHRNNLVGMGVLPLQLAAGHTLASLGLKGNETVDIEWQQTYTPGQTIEVTITQASASATTQVIQAIVRIDNRRELDYYNAGGILKYVATQLSNRK